jgi:cytochrome c6
LPGRLFFRDQLGFFANFDSFFALLMSNEFVGCLFQPFLLYCQNLPHFCILKQNYMNRLFFLLPILTILQNCTSTDNTPASRKDESSGSELFRKHCVLCHGASGNLGLNGARDLTQSKMSREQRVEIISNGKSVMPVFRHLLSRKEIEAVAEYTLSLSTAVNE